MSQASYCAREHRLWWRVTQRKSSFAYNGRGRRASEYSSLVCLECRRTWRTKSPYVARVRDLSDEDRAVMRREDAECAAALERALDTSQDTR